MTGFAVGFAGADSATFGDAAGCWEFLSSFDSSVGAKSFKSVTGRALVNL